jgi:hypothetical protein
MLADETIMLPVYRDVRICRMTTVTGFKVSVRLQLFIRCPHHALSQENGQQAKGGHDDYPASSREIEICGSVRR